MKEQLVFNTSATSDSDNVGSYMRAGSNGDLIGDQTISTTKWLQVAAAVFDGSGNAITSTSNALDVNIKNDTFQVDVGVPDGSVFTAGSSIEQPVGGFFATSYTALTTGHTGAFAMTAYRAMATSLQDQAGNYLGITAGALNVNVSSQVGASPFIVSDAALASTALATSQVTATGTAGKIPATALANRKYLFLQNLGNQSIYIGTSGVTTANGYRVPSGSSIELRLGAAVDIYSITGGSSQAVASLELS